MHLHTIKLSAIVVFAAMVSLCANAQTVQSTITLPNIAVQGIVVNPINNRIYVATNSGSPTVNDTVSVIDGNSDTIVANISVPAGAYFPAVDILTGRVYVASCNTLINPSPCFVTVIDGNTNVVLTTIPVSTVLDGFLGGITVNPITCTVYVSDNTNQDIAIIDERTNTLKGTISLAGSNPWGLNINPFTNELYVTLGTGEIDMINATTKQITQASTGADTQSFNVAVDLLTGHVFVTNTQSGASTTVVLDQKGTLIAEVPVGQSAFGVDVDPFTNLVFVANINDNSTSVINARRNIVKATVAGTYASLLSVNPVTRKVYAAGGNGIVAVSPE